MAARASAKRHRHPFARSRRAIFSGYASYDGIAERELYKIIPLSTDDNIGLIRYGRPTVMRRLLTRSKRRVLIASVLGPAMFLFNSLPRGVNSTVDASADDTVIYREISAEEDHHTLQADLDTLVQWEKEFVHGVSS